MLLLAGTGLCCLLDVKSTSGFTKGDKTRGQEKGQGSHILSPCLAFPQCSEHKRAGRMQVIRGMRTRLHIPKREDKSKETGCGLGVNSSEPGLSRAGEDGGRAVRITGLGFV